MFATNVAEVTASQTDASGVERESVALSCSGRVIALALSGADD